MDDLIADMSVTHEMNDLPADMSVTSEAAAVAATTSFRRKYEPRPNLRLHAFHFADYKYYNDHVLDRECQYVPCWRMNEWLRTQKSHLCGDLKKYGLRTKKRKKNNIMILF